MASGNSWAIRKNKKFIIIWLDSAANNTEDNLFTQQSLFNNFDNVEIYEDENQCQKYIKSAAKEQFIIIVSGTLSRQIIPNTHELQQVSAFYIYCINRKKHEQWANNYSKVRVLLYLSFGFLKYFFLIDPRYNC